jgi:hypothetical protein
MNKFDFLYNLIGKTHLTQLRCALLVLILLLGFVETYRARLHAMRGLKLPPDVQIGAERRRRGWAASIGGRALPKSARLLDPALLHSARRFGLSLGESGRGSRRYRRILRGARVSSLQRTSPPRDPKIECVRAGAFSSPRQPPKTRASFAGRPPTHDCWRLLDLLRGNPGFGPTCSP